MTGSINPNCIIVGRVNSIDDKTEAALDLAASVFVYRWCRNLIPPGWS
ncbi:MAG TPA: hypothetical protein VNI77_05420 [Nitrososphaera sp.]|nr:hypothetical protein [Nitrososphaera sp.]